MSWGNFLPTLPHPAPATEFLNPFAAPGTCLGEKTWEGICRPVRDALFSSPSQLLSPLRHYLLHNLLIVFLLLFLLLLLLLPLLLTLSPRLFLLFPLFPWRVKSFALFAISNYVGRVT